MSFVYWIKTMNRDLSLAVEIPEALSDILDNENGGISFATDPHGLAKGVVVTKEPVDPEWLKQVLDVDVVEFVKEEDLGPGSVLIDREGVRLQLAE